METSDPQPENRRRRRGVLFALLFALAAFGLVGAAAATLGGLGGQKLGADDGTVLSCDTDGVTLAYATSYDAASSQYVVTAVNVTGIAAPCVGETISVTLHDAANTTVSSGTATVAGATQLVTITPVSAKAVTGAAVVITGP
jgi:hypothetical protein